MDSGTRISWIDYAKVICIWLMVCCHAGQKGMILHMAYQFHMPALFIISGILFKPKGVAKTLLSFGVPILLYGVINLCYKLFVVGGDYSLLTLEWLKGFLFYTQTGVFQGYWFVLSLMCMRLLMEIKFIRIYKLWLAMICIVWCCLEKYLPLPSLLLQFRPYYIVSCLPFFVTGMMVKEKKIDVLSGSFEMKLIGFVVFFLITLCQGRPDLSEHNYGLSYLLFFANALLGSWLLFSLCNLAPKGRKWITSLATGTFLILGLHGMMISGFSSLFHKILGLSSPYLPLFSGTLVLGICYPLIRFCEKKCPLLLGKIH